MLVASIAIYTYYTTWALVLPFLPTDHTLQQLFPDRYWAIAGPLILLVLGLTGVGSFFSLLLIRGKDQKKQKAS